MVGSLQQCFSSRSVVKRHGIECSIKKITWGVVLFYVNSLCPVNKEYREELTQAPMTSIWLKNLQEASSVWGYFGHSDIEKIQFPKKVHSAAKNKQWGICVVPDQNFYMDIVWGSNALYSGLGWITQPTRVGLDPISNRGKVTPNRSQGFLGNNKYGFQDNFKGL